jgi:hypothetical protein
MRNKFFISAMLLVFASGIVWAQFWTSYTESERQVLAQAYWLAGKQYQAVGKTDKGKEFMRLARIIDPQLDPSTIRDEAMPSAAELLARGTTSPIGGGAGEIPVQSLSSFFLRFLGALLDRDSMEATGFLDGSIYLSKDGTELSRADAKTALDAFFSSAPLDGKTPSDLYNLNTVVISRVSPAMQQAWGETYTLRVDANVDFSQYLGFWEPKQQFFVHRGTGDWFIFAIGQNPPPLSWKPKAGLPVASAAPPASDIEAEASKGIIDSFNGCLDALLKKNADGALGYMSDQVKFLRLGQTVTRDELKTSLEGYFENTEAGSAQIADVVDTGSIFVEHAQSPVTGISGTVYSLSVRAKVDLSKKIPFWNIYQRYYFLNDGGQWKIFALL